MTNYWVIIETGANQRYIFGTNKRRANIGASELVHRVGTAWIPAVAGVVPVVEASGKAILLADSASAGEGVIEQVTCRALVDAPGLGVWGVVHPVSASGDHGLKQAHEALAQVRATSPQPEVRFQTIPFSATCGYTDLPASTVGAVGDDKQQPFSAPFASVFRVQGPEKEGPSTDGLNRLRDIVGVPGAVPDNLDPRKREEDGAFDNDPVQHRGWIAIIHADGNGIGNLFLNLAEDTEDLQQDLHAFSKALDEVTCQAVAAAAQEAARRYEQAKEKAPKEWLLPVIIGGDDVTVIIDAAMALDFTEAFLTEFAALAAQNPTIEAVNGRVNGEDPPPVTASAGIAYIKPHHPFSDGYDLAEQLCDSAKDLTKANKNASALDYHVLFDSVGRDLSAIRQQMASTDSQGDPLRLWSGPVMLQGTPDLATLHAAVVEFGKGSTRVSSAAAHALRSALVAGGPTIANTMNLRRLKSEARELCVAPDPTGAATSMTWVIDALALDEVSRGTSR